MPLVFLHLSFCGGEIFICKGTAPVWPPRTASLTASGFCRQPSQIKDSLSASSSLQGRAYLRLLLHSSDWVFRKIRCCLLVFPYSCHCLIRITNRPDKKPKSFKKKGKKKCLTN